MESVNNSTVVLPIITDAAGVLWGLTSAGVVTKNGVPDTRTSNVVLLLYFGHSLFAQNSLGKWYVPSAAAIGGWAISSDPRGNTTAPVTPTAPVVGGESAQNTLVTTVGPAITDKQKAKWTLVTSANGNQIAVDGVLDATTGLVTVLLYNNHKIYQSNSNGGWWSKSVSTDAWAGDSDPRIVSTPGSGTAPRVAVLNNYNKNTFNDDFTTTTTIPQPNGAQGTNWLKGGCGGVSNPTNFSVNTSAKAGGANGSAQGGILTLVGVGGNQYNLSLLDQNFPSPFVNGKGCYTNCYMECYMQFDPQANTTDGSNGWPAWWAYGAQMHTNDITEIDIAEYYPNTTSEIGIYLHDHPVGGGQNNPPATKAYKVDANWHTYGVLITPTMLSFYFDPPTTGTPVPIATQAVGNNTPGGLAGRPMVYQLTYNVLSAGLRAPMKVDWIRVWQQ